MITAAFGPHMYSHVIAELCHEGECPQVTQEQCATSECHSRSLTHSSLSAVVLIYAVSFGEVVLVPTKRNKWSVRVTVSILRDHLPTT